MTSSYSSSSQGVAGRKLRKPESGMFGAQPFSSGISKPRVHPEISFVRLKSTRCYRKFWKIGFGKNHPTISCFLSLADIPETGHRFRSRVHVRR